MSTPSHVFNPSEWRELLAARRRRELPLAGHRASAVLMPLFWREGRAHLLLTQRSDHVATHKGQICFPGGRQDPEDPDLLATALRECEEEIGVPRASIDVLGPLDDLTTIGTYRITPYLGVIPDGLTYTTDPGEVTAILELPVDEFLRQGSLRVELFPDPEGIQRKVYFYSVSGVIVWGATARIIKEWLDLVTGGSFDIAWGGA